MENKEWLKRWEENNIAFHQSEYESLLVKYMSSVPVGVVFVPFCGKTRDMLWFLQKGWEVIGAELSPLACKAFFEENHLEYKTENKGAYTLYQGEKITLWCGDFFALPSDVCSRVTAVYDRAALIALTKELRTKYAKHLTSLVGIHPNLRFLLITIDYDQSKLEGPPFSVDSAEVKRLYAEAFQIQVLEREEDTQQPPQSRFYGIRVFESAQFLSLKD